MNLLNQLFVFLWYGFRALAIFHAYFIFTALHGMQTRSGDENSVCLSVRLSARLSVCQTRDLGHKRKKDLSRFYTIRKIT